MEFVQSICILLTFGVIVTLMMTRKLPTILALPIMAVVIAFIAGIPFMSDAVTETGEPVFTIANDVLEKGSMRLSTAMAGLIFGGIFGRIMTKVGITHTIIRKAAELAGDKPMAIAFAFLIVTSVIFAASNGLGMVILVGTIIIPIMISAGVSPMVAGIVLLLGNAIGVSFAVNTLGIYVDVLGLDLATVTAYSWVSAVPLIIVSIIMIVYFIKIKGQKSRAWAMPNVDNNTSEKNVRSIALVGPLVPVLLVFIFTMPLVPAILIGIIATLILSTPKNPIQVVSSGIVEGIQETAGAFALMIGIGMLLNTVMAPQVSQILQPMINAVIPENKFTYVLIFGLLSPLAIYRGPLNVWGLGSGIVALLAAAGMNPIAAMVALRLDSNVQAVCDPTNSHNVWTADFTKTDVNDILRKTILWICVSTFIGLVFATFFITL